MCGIFGWIRRDGAHVDVNVARRALERIEHRGPDDVGYATLGDDEFHASRDPGALAASSVLLGHRRLSILDLSECGWQPFVSTDGRYAMVYNGEIYNYLELRSELETLGESFRSHSDTEVLLHAFARWGTNVLPRLVGMFAFVVVDHERRRMVMARDPFGIKPLFYADTGSGVAFASETKALLEIPGVSRRANPRKLYRYLTVGLADDGAETMLEGIRQVPAGHVAEWSLDGRDAPRLSRFFALDTEERAPASFEAAADELRALFLDSIRLHLRSDVPVGAALSGGIDSSAIVLGMRHLEPSLEIHAFSYVADDPRISEESWIRLAGGRAGALVHTTQATPDELVEDLDRLIDAQDEPFGSTSIYAQHRVFRLAHEHGIKVMLDGQGADEMLAGYSNFLGTRLASLLRRGRYLEAFRFGRAAGRLPHSSTLELATHVGGQLVPRAFRPAAKRVLGGLRRTPATWLDSTWFASHDALHSAPQRPGDNGLLRAQLTDSMEQGLQALLRYEDRNSMAHSVESRVPFLTPALSTFLLSLPEEYILSPVGTSKSVFRAAMRGIVPDAILDRRDKIGFSTPERRWLGSISGWVDNVLDSETARRIPALHVPAMRAEWRAILEGTRPFDWRVWRWINTIRWAEMRDVRFD